MFLEDDSYVDSLNITGDAVVINQCDRDKKDTHTRISAVGNDQRITYIETRERGLSRSRNMAKAAADADVCFLWDNDAFNLNEQSFGIYDRETGKVKFKKVVEEIMNAMM